MQIELRCRFCGCHFTASADCPYDAIMDRLTDDGLWFDLAEGDTFEDMIFAALISRGVIHCPDCCGPVSVSELSLAELDRELLSCR